MGIGIGVDTIGSKPDMMESSIVENPHTNAVRFRNKIYNHVIANRNLLGYPKNGVGVPYMFISNDLCGIFMEFIQLMKKHVDYPEIKDIERDLINILNLLILSYDDVRCDKGCCSFWHSVDKGVFVMMRDAMEKVAIRMNI